MQELLDDAHRHPLQLDPRGTQRYLASPGGHDPTVQRQHQLRRRVGHDVYDTQLERLARAQRRGLAHGPLHPGSRFGRAIFGERLEVGDDDVLRLAAFRLWEILALRADRAGGADASLRRHGRHVAGQSQDGASGGGRRPPGRDVDDDGHRRGTHGGHDLARDAQAAARGVERDHQTGGAHRLRPPDGPRDVRLHHRRHRPLDLDEVGVSRAVLCPRRQHQRQGE